MEQIYTDDYSGPNIFISWDSIWLTHVDFVDIDSCVITYTNDAGSTKVEKFSYLFHKGKHIFMSRESKRNFIYSGNISASVLKFQREFINIINSLL